MTLFSQRLCVRFAVQSVLLIHLRQRFHGDDDAVSPRVRACHIFEDRIVLGNAHLSQSSAPLQTAERGPALEGLKKS